MMLNNQLKEHLQFIEKMKKEFDELIQSHGKRLEEHKGEYRKLEKILIDHPSRPDDIRQIKLLLKEIETIKKTL